jgi:hypothetical protein
MEYVCLKKYINNIMSSEYYLFCRDKYEKCYMLKQLYEHDFEEIYIDIT